MASRNNVNYDDFGETFGRSRRSMRWEEIDLFLNKLVNYITGDQIRCIEKGGKGRMTNDEGRIQRKYKILDIGCGNGRLLKHISEHEERRVIQSNINEYVGIDISRVLLAQAEKDKEIAHIFPRQHLYLGDMRELGKTLSGQGEFDVMCFIASFHHLGSVEDRISVLSQAKKFLSKHGIIAMLNWNLFHPEHVGYLSSKKKEYGDTGADFMIKIGKFLRFYHAFSLKEFEILAKKAGLKILEQDFSRKNSLVILGR